MSNYPANTTHPIRFGPYLCEVTPGSWRVISVSQDKSRHGCHIEMFDWETGGRVEVRTESVIEHLTGAPLVTSKGQLLLPLASYSIDFYDLARGQRSNRHVVGEINGRPLALFEDADGQIVVLAERADGARLIQIPTRHAPKGGTPAPVQIQAGMRIDASDVITLQSAALFRGRIGQALQWHLYDLPSRRLIPLPRISPNSRIVPCSGDGPVRFAATAQDRTSICLTNMVIVDLPLHSTNAYVTAIASFADGVLLVAASHADLSISTPLLLEYRREGQKYVRKETRWAILPAKGQHIVRPQESIRGDFLVLSSSLHHNSYVVFVDNTTFQATSLNMMAGTATGRLVVRWPEVVAAAGTQIYRSSIFGADPHKYARDYEASGRWREAAQLWEASENWESAGRAWERAGALQDAVRCYRRQYEQNRNAAVLERTLGIARTSGDWKLEVEILAALHRDYDAATRIVEHAQKLEAKPGSSSDSELAQLYDRAISFLDRNGVKPWAEPRLTCENKARHYGYRPNLSIQPQEGNTQFRLGDQHSINLVVRNHGRGKALQARIAFKSALDALHGKLADDCLGIIGAGGAEWHPRIHVIAKTAGKITLYCRLTYRDEEQRFYELEQTWDIFVPKPEEKSPTIFNVYEGGRLIYGEHIQEAAAGDILRDHAQKGDRGDQVTIVRSAKDN